VAHAVYPAYVIFSSAGAHTTNKKVEAPMLTLSIICLVLIPMVLDTLVRGRHQTIELSMVRQK
jgi:hypothetical protein